MDKIKSVFSCPVCGSALWHDDKIYRCENNHCFDISKYKTVNLLVKQTSSAKRHGDDKLMLDARRDFLNTGAYKPFADEICKTAVRLCDAASPVLCDVGCGEGYYTSIIDSGLKESGRNVLTCGIDISKDALRYAKRRVQNGEFAAASAFRLPLADESCDLIVNIFAPYSAGEFYRTIKPGGTVIRAFARKNHLLGLKKAIYDEVRNEDVEDITLDGFGIVDEKELEYEITLKNSKEISDLFKMTPYYYKTSKEGQQKALELEELVSPVHFTIVAYQKK